MLSKENDPQGTGVIIVRNDGRDRLSMKGGRAASVDVSTSSLFCCRCGKEVASNESQGSRHKELGARN